MIKSEIRNITISIILLLSFFSIAAQNGFRSADGWGDGWSMTDFWNGTGFGTTFGETYKNTIGSDKRYFRLYTDWSNQTREHGPSGENDILIPFGTGTNLQTGSSKAYYLNVSGGPNAYNYIFRTKYGDGISNTPQLVVFEIQGDIQTISSVTQSPLTSSVSSSGSVLVTANSSGNLSTGQGIYLRYTIDSWFSSSVIEMSGSGTVYSASIPAQPSGITVKYYVFTSGSGLTIAHTDADWFTINGNTNNGSNFSYTVSSVTVNPPFPTDNVPVTITFNSSNTALVGVDTIYLHSGVSSTQSSPASFNHTTGNWGQDDGIGKMMNTGGNNWTITIPSLRSFYNVPDEKDVFGLNFLFRNVSGTLKEDKNGSNYFNAVDPGSYFSITFPTSSTHFALVGQPFNHTATANIAPDTWTLSELNPVSNAELSVLDMAGSNLNYTFSLTMTNTGLRKFKLTADFGGTIKSKTFFVTGYNPVIEMARPPLTKAGVNYHTDDPTKVTLILHAPTFTRYKKGNGTMTGMGNTTAKNIVYVIGDFNNWTPSESYKMFRDRDGWNDMSDSDNDDDRGDYWWIELSGLNPGQEYVFQYLIDGNIQVADPYTHKVSDPDDGQISSQIYPGLISYRSQAYDRASVLQTNQSTYQWTAAPFSKPTDNNLNIYELHFRDFTEEGTYLAAIEKLDYIKGLGINAIHVMPVSEFEGNSSWGYNPNFYFAADKAYGTIDDLKKFIDECHKRKIQVFNDLVLNHAFYSNVMARLYWNNTMNRPADDNPWFNPTHRMIYDQGGWWGVDWNHESEHTQEMVDRILDYWLQEFKFDGFRFDFTKGFGQSAPNNMDPWASGYNSDRIGLLMRMVDGMKARNPGSVAIFEHLAESAEDKVLADLGILMWSGVGHHDNLKDFILGYNDKNTNIYNSGIYNASPRNFERQNWMSYGESHDEERLAFEVKSYFNWASYTGPKVTSADSLAALVSRLKMAVAFNLLFPGPRMLWQFQEVGYDVSINFNGRTGEKPVKWDYYDSPKRKELYNLISLIFKLRNSHYWYSNAPFAPDYDNIGLGAGNITTPRRMSLKTTDGKQIIVIANLDPAASQSVMPEYSTMGLWYRHNGGIMQDTTFIVTDVNATYQLGVSESLILTNFNPYDCREVRNTSDSGNYSLRGAINCAEENDTIIMEIPVYGQTIQLSSPVNINKNITISGWPNRNVTVNGSGFNGSVFSIAEGKTVNMNGFKISCAQGASDGRCMVNSGILTLNEMELKDISGSTGGNSLFNDGSGTIKIENSVRIHK